MTTDDILALAVVQENTENSAPQVQTQASPTTVSSFLEGEHHCNPAVMTTAVWSCFGRR